jgi:hypothetical protein
LQGAEYLAETGNTNIPNQIDEMFGRTRASTQCFAWFHTRPKISRLEIRAALSLSINFLPVWLCTFPVTLNAIAIYWGFRLGTELPDTIPNQSFHLRLVPHSNCLQSAHVQYGPKKSEHRFYFESHLPTLRETMFHFWS